MGMFDSVYIKCPKCGTQNEFQSKGGDCFLNCYSDDDLSIPFDVLSDLNRRNHECCECETVYWAEFYGVYKHRGALWGKVRGVLTNPTLEEKKEEIHDDGDYNGPAVFPFKIRYEVEWPKEYKCNGMTYFYTGKLGKRVVDNCPVAEFEKFSGYDRIYLGLDGKANQ